ncbi:DUF6365 family protein [Longispora sp. K20-0274]|uniref:DUF6365 family protein n=1 Tax=Longispora sp. K20-0274 TaxID=3088255 RepID=UPI00399A00BC
MRRTVLFIVTSFWAYGELAIAIEFARGMAGTEFRPLFLIPPSHRKLIAHEGLDHQVLVPGSGKINRILLHEIQHLHAPAMVVLADFLNFDFCDRHYGLRRADLDIFECPLGTFDDFAWGRPGAWLDTYGFQAKYEADITLEGLSFRLRPCPLNNPLDETAGPDVHPYSLLDSVEDVPTTEREAVRRELGVRGDRPVVLVAGASWQRLHGAYPRVTPFVEACHAMLERLLTRLLEHADVVAVGPRLVFTDSDPDGFHHLGPVEPERFGRLTQAVDLHLGNNIVSVSLHRLALGGIPSVVLMNSLHKHDGRAHWELPDPPALTEYAQRVVTDTAELYPYRMFPVGWFHFLRSLLDGNPFADMVSQVEMFDEETALATVVPLLSAGPERDRLAESRQTYLTALRKLGGVDTILRQVAAL